MESDKIEDAILKSIDQKNQKPQSNYWVDNLNWKSRKEYQYEKTPLVKKLCQKQKTEEIESNRSKYFEINGILKTRLNIRPVFSSHDYSLIHIQSKQSLKPKIIFNANKINIESFIDFDIKHYRALLRIGERHLLFNTYPTCAFDVPKCDSIQELQNIITKKSNRPLQHQQVIRKFNIIPNLLYFVLYHINEPSQFAPREPTWEDKFGRKRGVGYQSPHHLLKKFYPDYIGRIDFISLIDNTVVHDCVLNKWIKFQFYPQMFEKEGLYSIGTKYEENKSVLLMIENFKISGFK